MPSAGLSLVGFMDQAQAVRHLSFAGSVSLEMFSPAIFACVGNNVLGAGIRIHEGHLGWCPMRRTADNPDRNFSADPHESEPETLRSLLQRSEPADLLDRVVRERIGRAIAAAVHDPKKPHV